MAKNMGFTLEKKQQRSRAEAEAIYHELHKRMTDSIGKPEHAKASANQPKVNKVIPQKSPMRSVSTGNAKFVSRGSLTALILMMAFAGIKVTISAMEALEIGDVKTAQAMVNAVPVTRGPQNAYSSDEVKILTSLDQRRVELDTKIRDLASREADLNKRDREFAVKLTELRELSKALKLQRDKNELKRVNQLEQLAHVYGSMNPTESAVLIEQLDITIALELIGRMPEKRIGQILALMSPERALMITKMLSGQS